VQFFTIRDYKRFTIIMAFKPEKFTYQPLQEPMDFRLLELLPGERDKTLKCSLTHSSLTSHPYYHAVSYTWGTSDLLQEIELCGVVCSIRANLFDFLQQLRLTYAAVTLWVDALCINQNDILEKNIQVPLMGLIYSYAKSVLVWLGPQADGSEEYFDFCNPIPLESQSLHSSVPKNVDSNATNPISAAIASLQRRAYWTRTWIIQEIVLASDIHIFCGDRFSHWPNFTLHMPDRDTDNQAIGMRNPTHPLGKLKQLRIVGTELTLRQLLFQCYMSRCSDPRDLIYGLLNIAKDTKDNPSSIAADYSCSLETLFLQSMSCCSLPQMYDGISCLQFCDTLSTRLGVDLGRALACAKETLQFSPTSALAEKLTSRSYFAKLTRFGRFLTQPPAADGNSLQDFASAQAESKIPHPLTQHTVREIPGTKSLHHMWSFDIPEATDTIFILNFESPTNPSQRLACICRPIHHNADEYGVIPYRVVGLGVIPRQSNGDEECERELDMQATHVFLRDDLHFLHGRVVADSIPGYGLEVGLLELIRLCIFARVAGSFVRWSIDDTTAAEHWKWA
jgi:Heterokaryon incompatibility protein (HET)